MRSDDWILVENAFAETLSNSSAPESLVVEHESSPDDSDVSFGCFTCGNPLTVGDYTGACHEESDKLINGDLDISEFDNQDPPDFSALTVLAPSSFTSNFFGERREFSTLSIMSPRIDPELGRLAAVNLRAGNLVGCIYKPDVELQRTSQRFKERASMLLKAN